MKVVGYVVDVKSDSAPGSFGRLRICQSFNPQPRLLGFHVLGVWGGSGFWARFRELEVPSCIPPGFRVWGSRCKG